MIPMPQAPKRDNDYAAFRANPSNDHISDGIWCVESGVKIEDLQKWKAESPEIMEEILKTRRSRYADEMIQIDSALLRKAKAGDARSIQLAWARFENWSPKIEEEASKKTGGRNKTLAELISEGS
jgi:hypothetical protein